MIKKRINLIKQLIAILTIIGCLYSFVMGLWTLVTKFELYSIIDIVLFIVCLCLYLIGIKLSVELYSNNLKHLFLFEIFTLLQFFAIEGSFITYRFTTMFNLLIYYKLDENDHSIFGVKFSAFDFFNWGVSTDLKYFYCSINIAAILILVFINIYLSPKKNEANNINE